MSFHVYEQTTARYTAQLKDETGAVVPAASIATLTLTLRNEADNAIINSRSNQNVLNMNGVTVDVSGNLVWTMDPADNAVIDATQATERHRATVKWTYGSGKKGNHEVEFVVINRGDVP